MACILVVDDEKAVLGVVKRALTSQGHSVIGAMNGREALSALATGPRPDVVVLDIMMKGIDGIQVCQAVRSNPLYAGLPILFLTAKAAVDDRITGLESGADDYLTKPFDIRELQLRVQALVRYSERNKRCAVVRAGAIEVDADMGEARIDGAPVALTPIEFDLLEYMAMHAGEVIGSQRLLKDVWGYPDGDGSTSLVRMHMLNLRRKIEEDPQNPRYLCTVPRHGYILRGDS